MTRCLILCDAPVACGPAVALIARGWPDLDPTFANFSGDAGSTIGTADFDAADVICVMDRGQERRLTGRFAARLHGKRIVVLESSDGLTAMAPDPGARLEAALAAVFGPRPEPRRLAPGDPDLAACLGLIRESFAGMAGRIDPPSSIHRLAQADLDGHAVRGELWAIGTPPLAAVIATPMAGHLYLGKLAVAARARGRGLARRLIEACAADARNCGLPLLRLSTRIELTENHATFAALGFRRAGETAHPGFERTTSLTFERDVP